MKKIRTGAQDAAKGFMIISVIFFHCMLAASPNPSESYKSFNILIAFFPFLLSSFFFYTGYNYVDKGRSFKENISRRAKQLLIPLVVCIAVSTILISSMQLIYDHSDVGATFQAIGNTLLYSLMSEPLAMMAGFPQSGGIVFELVLGLGLVWFLYALFICSIFFYLLVKYTNKKLSTLISVDIICLVAAFSLGQFVGTYLPYHTQCYPLILAIMLAAAYLRQHSFLDRPIDSKKSAVLQGLNALIAEGLVIGTALVCHYEFGAVFTGSLPGGQYDGVLRGFDALIAFAFSIIGTYFIHTLCRLVVKIPVFGVCISYIGSHSAIFYLFHPIYIALFSILVFQKQIPWGYGQAFFYVGVSVALLAGTCLLLDLLFKKKKNFAENPKIVENGSENEGK